MNKLKVTDYENVFDSTNGRNSIFMKRLLDRYFDQKIGHVMYSEIINFSSIGAPFEYKVVLYFEDKNITVNVVINFAQYLLPEKAIAFNKEGKFDTFDEEMYQDESVHKRDIEDLIIDNILNLLMIYFKESGILGNIIKIGIVVIIIITLIILSILY